MPSNFPVSIDIFGLPTSSTELNDAGNLSHALQHSDANDAIRNIENTIGVNNSDDINSIQYKLNNLDPNQTRSFYFDIETGSDGNEGTINSPFKTMAGLKRRVVENSISGMKAHRQIYEELSIGGSTRAEIAQHWEISARISLIFYFKNKYSNNSVQVHELPYRIISAGNIYLIGWTDNLYDFSTTRPFNDRILPKLQTNTHVVYYTADNISAGPGPFFSNYGFTLAEIEMELLYVDYATEIDLNGRESWVINSANWQTFFNGRPNVVLYFYPTLSTSQSSRVNATSSLTEREDIFLENFRYINSSGAIPTSIIQAIQWSEAGQLFSTVHNYIVPTRFPNLFTNPWATSFYSTKKITMYWGVLRLRDSSLTLPLHYGFHPLEIVLYQINIINERSGLSELRGCIINSATDNSNFSLLDYNSQYVGFDATWEKFDAFTKLTDVNLAYNGQVNPANNKLFYPNARVSIISDTLTQYNNTVI